MARKQIPLPKFLIPKLRQISRWWHQKGVALDKAKVYVPDGKFKNGNPKTKVKYVCAECKRLKKKSLYDIHQVQADHIDPVVNVDGFTNWDDYILRLFCNAEGFQILCEDHHKQKTQRENEERRRIKAENKKNSE